MLCKEAAGGRIAFRPFYCPCIVESAIRLPKAAVEQAACAMGAADADELIF